MFDCLRPIGLVINIGQAIGEADFTLGKRDITDSQTAVHSDGVDHAVAVLILSVIIIKITDEFKDISVRDLGEILGDGLIDAPAGLLLVEEVVELIGFVEDDVTVEGDSRGQYGR